MPLRKNDVLTLDVTGMNDMGNGVARHEGMVIFVTGAVTGDVVTAKIVKLTSHFAVARTEKVITPSPFRVENDCTSRGCGGCAYRLLSYEKEKELKREDVRHAFLKAGLSDTVVLPVLSTEKTTAYRNKAQYPVGKGKNGEMVAGFYAAHSHRVVPAAGCPLQAKIFQPILRHVLDFCNQNAVAPYDEETGQGLLRHVYLRTSADEGEVLLTLVINGSSFPKEAALVTGLRHAFPMLVGILLNENRERTNVICGTRYRTLWGRDYLMDRLCGVRLRISPPAFYQVNHDAAALLYETAKDMAAFRGDETLLDLYCGIGSIGLSMQDAVARVVGIEIVPEAVACAKKNAADNGITNADFFSGDAADFGTLLAAAREEIGSFAPNAVVLDPPRKGCAAALLCELAEDVKPEKILYISCNPDTLARDSALLCSHGYNMGAVQPVDLFPRTGHVECVTCFKREKM